MRQQRGLAELTEDEKEEEKVLINFTQARI